MSQRKILCALCGVLFFSVLLCSVPSVQAEVREAQVAGSFYPDNPDALRTLVTQLLNQQPEPDPSAPTPLLLIVPHAGYEYSGPVAARAFRQVQGRSYDGVVVVGFTHRDQFEGSSVDDRDGYQTPLGAVPIDTNAASWLVLQPGLSHVESAHASGEHSMEVMLPFLQVSLGDFKLIPVVMGSVELEDAQALAESLATLAKQGSYLFVFSTDLSHYHPYDEAKRRDEQTINLLLRETAGAVDRLFQAGHLEACGRGPILVALSLAERLGYPQRRLLVYANSGDTTGDKSQGVVGYAAIDVHPVPLLTSDPLPPRLSSEAGMALVRAARATLQNFFHPRSAASVSLESFPELSRTQGMFVTLRRRTNKELRGCIGRIEGDEPLATLLPKVTLDAALRDTRFKPMTAEELDQVQIEVSILTPPAPVPSVQEIIAGRDGVILQKDGRGGLFLPQVWHETGWTRLEFLRELASQKAGLPPDAWQDAQLLTFQDQAFEEH